jgi:acetylornithine deacetylase/succinyl-diaminopimelate desuccinylase-like protein
VDSNGVLLIPGRVQGFVMNLQPSEAEAGFDIRVPPSADLGDLWRRIREEWAPASCNLTYTVSQNSKPICLLFCSLFSSVGKDGDPYQKTCAEIVVSWVWMLW